MLKEHAKIDNVLDFDLSLNTVEEINKMQEKGDVKVTTIVQNEKKVSLKDQFVYLYRLPLYFLINTE